jgi:hypothetical protein
VGFIDLAPVKNSPRVFVKVTRDTNVCDEPVVPVLLLLFSWLKRDYPEIAILS